MIAMVPLTIGICIEVYLLGHLVIGDVRYSLLLAGALFAVFIGLWFVFPCLMRERRSRN